MNSKVFGLLEHVFMYLVAIFLVAFIFFELSELVYLALISWILGVVCHVLESKKEGKNAKKIIIGV